MDMVDDDTNVQATDANTEVQNNSVVNDTANSNGGGTNNVSAVNNGANATTGGSDATVMAQELFPMKNAIDANFHGVMTQTTLGENRTLSMYSTDQLRQQIDESRVLMIDYLTAQMGAVITPAMMATNELCGKIAKYMERLNQVLGVNTNDPNDVMVQQVRQGYQGCSYNTPIHRKCQFKTLAIRNAN